MTDAGQAAVAQIIEHDRGRSDAGLAAAARAFLAALFAAQVGYLAEQLGAFGLAEAAGLEAGFEAGFVRGG